MASEGGDCLSAPDDLIGSLARNDVAPANWSFTIDVPKQFWPEPAGAECRDPNFLKEEVIRTACVYEPQAN